MAAQVTKVRLRGESVLVAASNGSGPEDWPTLAQLAAFRVELLTLFPPFILNGGKLKASEFMPSPHALCAVCNLPNCSAYGQRFRGASLLSREGHAFHPDHINALGVLSQYGERPELALISLRSALGSL